MNQRVRPQLMAKMADRVEMRSQEGRKSQKSRLILSIQDVKSPGMTWI